MDDLDRLPNMSPTDDPRIPLMSGRAARPLRMTTPRRMILGGMTLTLVCGLLLFFVYGLASMVLENNAEYWSLVLGRMFGLEHGGWVAIPALFGMLLGVVLVVLGLVKAGKRR
jgi:hypothetical protein